MRRLYPTAAVLVWCGLAGLLLPSSGRGEAVGDDSARVVRGALDSAAALLSEGRARDALAVLARAEPLEPDNPWLLFYQGVSHLQLGNAYEAIARFWDTALTWSPRAVRLRMISSPTNTNRAKTRM